MKASAIMKCLEVYFRNEAFIPEYTWNSLRIDAISINTRERKVRGFEIKVSREDFLQDKKWHLYSQFCSSLTLVCPEGLIRADEIPKPFGLLYVTDSGIHRYEKVGRDFNKRDLAWTWRYLEIIEKELPRLVAEKWRAENAVTFGGIAPPPLEGEMGMDRTETR